MPTLTEQLSRLADIVFPPLHEYDLHEIELRKKQIRDIRANIATKELQDWCELARRIRNYALHVREAARPLGQLKENFINQVQRLRKGRNLRLGKGMVSLELPSMTLKSGSLVEVIDDLRLQIRFRNRRVDEVIVTASKKREFPHPSVFREGVILMSDSAAAAYKEAADKIDLEQIYGIIATNLALGEERVVRLERIHGYLCPNCNQRGGHSCQVEGIKCCNYCIATCRCGKFLPPGTDVSNGCKWCTKYPCPSCQTMTAGKCMKCNMKCGNCYDTYPKRGHNWLVGTWNRGPEWTGAWACCENCARSAFPQIGAAFIRVNWDRYPELAERLNLRGEDIYRADPSAELDPLSRPGVPF